VIQNFKASYGFTLMEILVAMAILSLILTMVYTILISTLNSRDLVQRQTHLDRTADKLMGLIVRDLQAVQIYQIQGLCFVGKSQAQGDRVDFVSSSDNLLGSEEAKSDLCEISYYLKPNTSEHGAYLLMRREDFFLDDNLLDGGFAVKLYDRVAVFQLRYIDDKGNPKRTWNSQDDQGLPFSICITLGLRSAPPSADPEVLQKSIEYYKVYVPIFVSSKPPQAKPQKPGTSESSGTSGGSEDTENSEK